MSLLKERKAYAYNKTYKNIYGSFVIAKNWKQSQNVHVHQQANGWTNCVIYLEYYSQVKKQNNNKKTLLIHATTLMNFQILRMILKKPEKIRMCCMIPFTYYLYAIENGNLSVVTGNRLLVSWWLQGQRLITDREGKLLFKMVKSGR